ncbi:histidine kinase [Granulicella sibirica]|uniref:histidine kinase n=2 Tax=Granulicella sibirica TaxID=2479048 RepID=A0A4Q0T1Y3_9BACT|nr:histidine kinase [Granulicella sibirica]
MFREHVWSNTPLGRLEDWSETLVATVNMLLLSPFAFTVFWGQELTLLYNDSYRVFLGSKHPDSLGRPAREVWREAWPVIGATIEDALHHGARSDFKHMLIPIELDGVLQDRYWTLCFYPVYENGEIAGVAEIVFDSTSEVLAERKLHESREESSRVLQSIGDAVIVTDAETRVTRMNPISENLTGWSQKEAKGRPLSEVFHIVNETTRKIVESPADKVKRLGTVVGLANHTTLIAKDGAETAIDDSGAPIRDDQGEITGIVLVFRDIAERRAAEREREAHARHLQEVLDVSADGVAELDREWRIVFLNEKAKEMLAGSGDVLGKNHWESFPSAVFDGSPWLRHYYAAMDEGKSGEFDHFYPAPLNIWMHITVRPASSGIVIYFRDTTEQHRAAEALRASEERLRLALAAAKGVGIWDWDVVNDLVYADEGFARLYGVDPAEARAGITIQHFTRNMHRDDKERVGHEIAEAVRTGHEFSSEYRLVQSDGSVRWVSAVGRCSLAADGRPTRFPGVTVDITSPKAVETSLRESEDRLRIAAETAYLGVWEVSLPAMRMECSDICKANFGRAAGEPFSYEDLLASIHPDDLAGMQEAVRSSVANGTPYRSEYRVYWPDGTLHWIVASGRGLYHEAGEPSHMVGVTMDITERRLAETALLQSEKLAAVGRLAASIAHEINNPLESVTNLLYLARGGTKIEEIQDYLDMAERELRRVSVISSQTLRFHRQSTNPKEVTCEDLIETVLSIHQGRIVNSRVGIKRRLRATKPVACFEGEIRQVLNNLAGNAIDAMHPVGGTLFVRGRNATDWSTGRLGLAITIADTGAGMSAQTLRKIFEPFFTTKGLSGTGLGLWVSKEIIDRHEGVLRVMTSQRAPHTGTVFSLFLPFQPAPR